MDNTYGLLTTSPHHEKCTLDTSTFICRIPKKTEEEDNS